MADNNITNVNSFIEESVKDLIHSSNSNTSSDCESKLYYLLFIRRFLNNNNNHVDIKELTDLIKNMGHRQVCQYQFKPNDIIWICKECQKDETCVLCNDCFSDSSHEGHEVYFYHSAYGGCCDCGDHDAWDCKGFCSKHGSIISDPISLIPTDMVDTAKCLFISLLKGIDNYCVEYTKMFNVEEFSLYYSDKMFSATENDSLFLYFFADDFHSDGDYLELFSAMEIINLLDNTYVNIASPDFKKNGTMVIYKVDIFANGDDNGEKLILIIDKLRIIEKRGFQVALFDKNSVEKMNTVNTILNFLKTLSLLNDGMCRLISSSFSVDMLHSIMRVNMRLDRSVSRNLHDLLLNLMADQSFKMSTAIAYCHAYSAISLLFKAGIGQSVFSLYNLSVQFLNRELYVNEVVYHYKFFKIIISTLNNTLQDSNHKLLNLKHNIITKRRYNPIMGDMKVIFVIQGISRFFLSSCLPEWLDLLRSTQFMHFQTRSLFLHVDYEDRDWMSAFNLYLSVTAIFEYILNWFSFENSPFTIDLVSPTSLTKDSGSSSSRVKNDSFFSNLSFNVVENISNFVINNFSSKTYLLGVYSIIEGVMDVVSDWQQTFTEENCTLGTIKQASSDSKSKEVNLVSRPIKNSFHIPLHRFLATIIHEAAKHPHLSFVLMKLETLIKNSYNTINHLILIDIPLFTMIFSSEIKIGIWRRNGSCMNDQLMNYTDSPFSRVYKDLDRFLIQYCMVSYPYDSPVTHILHRFGLNDCFLNNNMTCSNGVNESYFCGLLNEFLIFLINLVTDLPTPPHENITIRLRPLLRRELIHKLVIGPQTYSKILECFSIYPEFSKINPNDILDIINEVADKQVSNNLSAPTYILKKECWKEYDISFSRLNDSVHQSAIELKPKVTSNVSIVSPPIIIHEYFLPLIPKILFDQSLFHILKVLTITIAAHETKNEKFTNILTSQSISYDESIFSRVIQLFTLIILSAKNETSKQRINNFIIDLIEIIPSVQLSLLDCLYELQMNSKNENKYYIGWIVDQFCLISETCNNIINSKSGKIKESNNNNNEEDRKRLMREKAMQDIQNNANKFLSFMADMSDDEDENEDDINCVSSPDFVNNPKIEAANDNSTEEMTTKSHAIVIDQPVCIICHDVTIEYEKEGSNKNNNSLIGYLAFCQSSKILSCVNSTDTLFSVKEYDEDVVKNDKKYNNSNLNISFCGHCVHFTCFEHYMAENTSRYRDQRDLIFDSKRHQFSCPLCKKISNILVPHQKENNITKEEMADVNETSWIEWIDNIKSDNIIDKIDDHDNTQSKRFRTEEIDEPESLITFLHCNEFEHLIRIVMSNSEIEECINNNPSRIFSESEIYNAIIFNTFLVHFAHSIYEFETKPIFEELGTLLEIVASSITYTVCLDLAENSLPGYFLIPEEDIKKIDNEHLLKLLSQHRNNDMNHLFTVVDVLSSVLSINKKDMVLLNYLSESLNVNCHRNKYIPVANSQNWLFINENSSINYCSILKFPLLDYLVLYIAVNKVSSENSPNNIKHVYKWICIAKLVQLFIIQLPDLFSDENINELFSDFKSICPLLECIFISIKSTGISTKHQFSSSNSKTGNETKYVSPVKTILFEWIRFLRAVSHLFYRLLPNQNIIPLYDWSLWSIENCDSACNIDDILVLRHIEALQLSSIVANQDSTLYFNKFQDVILRWLRDFELTPIIDRTQDIVVSNKMEWMQLLNEKYNSSILTSLNDSEEINHDIILKYNSYPYSSLRQLSLIELPKEYTKLHSLVNTKCSFENPAVCLICGTIVDCGGKGQCHAHTIDCGGESCIFFLVQDCNILLCYGPRCYYYPTPYVDVFGESNQGYRGKPLHLDKSRYDLLRRMWATSGIASEVTMKRSTASRLIILGYY